MVHRFRAARSNAEKLISHHAAIHIDAVRAEEASHRPHLHVRSQLLVAPPRVDKYLFEDLSNLTLLTWQLWLNVDVNHRKFHRNYLKLHMTKLLVQMRLI